jgi:hypothetical protein
MGTWPVDLGMKVRDKRFPRFPKMVKDLMDGKSAATIQVWLKDASTLSGHDVIVRNLLGRPNSSWSL